MAWRIVVIDHVGSPLNYAGLLAGCRFDRLEWVSGAPGRLRECKGDLLIASALGDGSAPIELFRWLLASPVTMPVFAIVPEHADDELLRITARMAADFAVWPARPEEIHHRVARILGAPHGEVDAVADRLSDEVSLRQLVGRDPAFLHVIAQIPLVARSNRPVLITGETGTGKELCARAIHHLGRRRDCPFIAVDCGAFPDSLFDNELFGHTRGAFTDAYREQKGLVAMAEGGTLFLDEVDSLSPSSQAKLLRFLQERTYRPLGADRFLLADVNVLAATNRDLDELVREKRFRADLFFRLSVLRMHMPPLRDRRDDIPMLARHFLDTLCADEGIARKTLAPATLVAMQRTDWPGNVRELYNIVQRAFVFADGPQVLPAHITAARTGVEEPAAPQDGGFRAARARAIEVFERE